MFRSILCAVDFSEHSRQALRWADRLRAPGGRLTLVTAVDPLLAGAARARFGIDLVTDGEKALREFAATTLPNDQHENGHHATAIVGQPDAVIRKVANQVQADLIVLGTHGLGGFRKWLLGSTTEQVLRATRTPVLAVPLADSGRASEDQTVQPLPVERILAATDFSVPATYALKRASHLARATGASMLMAHVVAPVVTVPQWRSYVKDLDEENVSRGRARLEQLARDLSADTCASETVVAVGKPADAIAAIARQHDVQLIVLGIVGDAWDMAHRPGSIAYRVLCLAHVPVLAIPPPGHAASESSGNEDGSA